MSDNVKTNDSAFIDDNDEIGNKINVSPLPAPNVEADTDETIFDNIVGAGESRQLDLTALDGFTSVSQSRDKVFTLIDSMCEDSIISAVLRTIAEDATEYSDSGRVVWAESSDSTLAKHVQFLLDTMNVDKYAFGWIHSLAKYGDLYLRLYRDSEYNDDDLFDGFARKKQKNKKDLKEDVNVVMFPENDHYSHYVEAEPNPAEMFELTRHGKSYAYIKTHVIPTITNANANQMYNDVTLLQQHYDFDENDIDLHSPLSYVHACLDDVSNRTPEEVTLFNITDKNKNDVTYTYKVKRGQSIFYDVFKVWRELSLLENSMMLNRVTRSSIIRAIQVQVGDMPKNKVTDALRRIKSLIEQKTAVNDGQSISEYTNPGPIDNTIYIPVRGEKGGLTVQSVGGDVGTIDLSDIEYLRDKLFGALGIPKQYFGATEDGAGFNGGQSLAILSSRYAKTVKRLQNALIQALTDAVNLMLLDSGMESSINKFTIKMQPPTTQEDIDRRENTAGKVQLVRDVMDLVTDLPNETSKLEILKSLLSGAITNTEVIDVIQKERDKMEEEGGEETTSTEETDTLPGDDLGSVDMGSEESSSSLASDLGLDTGAEETSTETEEPTEEGEGGEETLPTPAELGIGDLTNNNNPEI